MTKGGRGSDDRNRKRPLYGAVIVLVVVGGGGGGGGGGGVAAAVVVDVVVDVGGGGGVVSLVVGVVGVGGVCVVVFFKIEPSFPFNRTQRAQIPYVLRILPREANRVV